MPVEQRVTATDDLESGEVVLNDFYRPERPLSLSGDTADFRLDIRELQYGDLGISHLDQNMVATAEAAGPIDDFVALTVASGHTRFDAEGDEFRMRAGDVARFPRFGTTTARWNDLEMWLVRIPFAAVERVAAAHADADATPHFSSIEAASPTAAARWRRLTSFVADTLTAPSFLDSPIVATCLVEAIAANVLTVFPNSTMTASYTPGPGRAGPATLRRALDFLEAHADEPLTLHDLAVAAGTTGRALQASFRRHVDMTPMEYLRTVRLHRARAELREAADGPADIDAVEALARRWGFASVRAFVRGYTAQFGEPPALPATDDDHAPR